MKHITTPEQFKNLQDAVVWFSAAWCVPCQHMDKQLLESAIAESGRQEQLYYCDETVVDIQSLGIQISQFPTFVIFKNGQEIARRTTADSVKIWQFIRKYPL